MAGETTLAIVGNLTADPELKTTQSGRQLANVTIASTPRIYDRQSGQWQDGQALFLRCTAWGDLASHIVSSLSKGMRVIAQGRLTQRSWQDEQGANHTVIEMQLDEIGPSLRYATAQVSRISRQGDPVYGNPASPQPSAINTGAGGWSQQPQQPAQSTQPPAEDPWGAPAASQSFGEFGKTGDEPDF